MMTHMDGSDDEGRILYDKNFFLEIKTSESAKEEIIRIFSNKF